MKKILLSLFVFVIAIGAKESFAQGVWTQKATFPGTARGDAFNFSLGTKGYVGGGEDISGNFANDFWEYEAMTNTWEQKSNFIDVSRWQAGTFSIGTKGYVCTGGGSSNTALWEYDSSTDSWMQKANFINARNTAVGFSIGTRGYMGTGASQGPICEKDFWEYNPSSNTWIQRANIPIGRSYAVGLSIGANGYIGTGADCTGNVFDDFWRYDTTSDSWTQKANFPGGKRLDIDGGHFAIGNYGYIGTGCYPNSISSFNDFWEYNPSNDTWSQIPSLPAQSRIGACGFSLNNKGYIGFGFWFTSAIPNYLNDLWEYDPNGNGISENEFENSLSLSSNPAWDKLQITISKFQNEEIVAVVFDVMGKQVGNKQSAVGNKTTIDISFLEKGVYYLKVSSEGVTAVKKFIKM